MKYFLVVWIFIRRVSTLCQLTSLQFAPFRSLSNLANSLRSWTNIINLIRAMMISPINKMTPIITAINHVKLTSCRGSVKIGGLRQTIEKKKRKKYVIKYYVNCDNCNNNNDSGWCYESDGFCFLRHPSAVVLSLLFCSVLFFSRCIAYSWLLSSIILNYWGELYTKSYFSVSPKFKMYMTRKTN